MPTGPTAARPTAAEGPPSRCRRLTRGRLSKGFLDRVEVPLINIHRSFLPAFPGAEPYERAKERGVKLIGFATATRPWCSEAARERVRLRDLPGE